MPSLTHLQLPDFGFLAFNIRTSLLTTVSVFLILCLPACSSDSSEQMVSVTTQQQTPDTFSPFNNIDLLDNADLTDDALLPPELVPLTINADLGELTLSWVNLDNQVAASIYQIDALDGSEVVIGEFLNSAFTKFSIPSNSHLRAWHGEKFRIELCTLDNCISSDSVDISGLLERTVQRITPAVFSANEKFADNIAINDSASLMVAALPFEGAIEFYIKPGVSWISTQRLNLQGADLSSSRELHLASSSSGDTIAVLSTDNSNIDMPTLTVLERFGEAWIELSTPNLVIPSEDVLDANQNQATDSPDEILLSAEGNHLFILHRQKLYSSMRTSSGWNALIPLQNNLNLFTADNSGEASSIQGSGSIEAIAADMSHRNLFVIVSDNQTRKLNTWTRRSNNNPRFTQAQSTALTGFQRGRDIYVRSNRNGSQIAVAGWEASTGIAQTPIMWRYDIFASESESLDDDVSLSTTDSIRFPTARSMDAQLRFSANQSLTSVALGWQSPVDAETTPDASLITYQFNASNSRWTPQLELPADFPTFAKQAFLRRVNLTASGNALLLAIEPGHSVSGNNRVGEVIAFH